MLPDDAPPKWLPDISNQQDILAKSIRVGLSACGPLGAVIGEFLTEFVPGQRIDRLQEFVEQVQQRLGDVEEQVREKLRSSPGYSSLTEQVTIAAVQTASSQRRRDLAELLRTGLSRTDAEMVQHHALLKLLNQLNDAQVVILVRFGFEGPFGDPAREAYLNAHPEVFVLDPPAHGDTDEAALRRWTMYLHYQTEMVSLGVLKDTEGVVKSSPIPRLAITPLGRLLLDAIGQSSSRS